MSYWRQRRVIELHKKMTGREYVEVPDEIIQLEEAIRKIEGSLKSLIKQEAPEVKLSLVASELAPLEYRYRQLLISFGLEK